MSCRHGNDESTCDLCAALDARWDAGYAAGKKGIEAVRASALVEIDSLRAENARLSPDRYDALSVKSKEGLLASEWIARTGRAEREAESLRAENERFRKASSWQHCDTHGPGNPNAWGCPECVREMRKQLVDLRAENEALTLILNLCTEGTEWTYAQVPDEIAKLRRKASGPDPLSEALNSGDGSYRP